MSDIAIIAPALGAVLIYTVMTTALVKRKCDMRKVSTSYVSAVYVTKIRPVRLFEYIGIIDGAPYEQKSIDDLRHGMLLSYPREELRESIGGRQNPYLPIAFRWSDGQGSWFLDGKTEIRGQIRIPDTAFSINARFGGSISTILKLNCQVSGECLQAINKWFRYRFRQLSRISGISAFQLNAYGKNESALGRLTIFCESVVDKIKQNAEYGDEHARGGCPMFGFNVIDNVHTIGRPFVNTEANGSIIFQELSDAVQQWPKPLVIVVDLLFVGAGLVLLLAALADLSNCSWVLIPALISLVVGYWFVFSTPL